jgi:hypothetical protein
MRRSKREIRKANLARNPGRDIMLQAKVTFLNPDEREDSHLQIGDETIFINTGTLIDAFCEAEDFLDANVDGG